MHFVFCPKQGNKLKFVFLNRGCILGLFYPKQGQSFKPSVALTYTKILVEYPPPPDLNSYLAPCVNNKLEIVWPGRQVAATCRLVFNGKVKKTLSALMGGSISNVNLNH